jgi:hypothetical protein
MNAPIIQCSEGTVPERHADRVVRQMVRFLIAERPLATPKIIEILKTWPDASPRCQGRILERLRAAAAAGFGSRAPQRTSEPKKSDRRQGEADRSTCASTVTSRNTETEEGDGQ